MRRIYKKLLLILCVVPLATAAWAEDTLGQLTSEEGRFIHSSKSFSIVPPRGHKEKVERADGVQFINLLDKSFMSISFSVIAGKSTDRELLERYNDTEFRKSFIANLEVASASLQTKVRNTKPRMVNGIPAFEFVTEGVSSKGPLQNNYIFFYKDQKEFIIVLGAAKEFFNMELSSFDESLGTFKVIESAPAAAARTP